MNIFSSSRLSLRFALVIALFTLGFVIYGAWSFKTLNELKVNGQIYQRIVQGKNLIADILPPPKYIIESYLVSLQLSGAKEKAEQHGLIDRLKTLKGEYDTRHEFWLKDVLEGNIGELLLRQAHVPVVAFYAIAFNELVPAVQKNDRAAAAAAMAQMKSLYEIHRKVIDQIVQLTGKRVEADEMQAKERIQSASFLLLTILVVTMGVIVAASVHTLQAARKMTLRLMESEQESKRAYKKLEQNERNFKRAQQIVNMGSWQLDLLTRVLTCSDETCRIFGLPIGSQPIYQVLIDIVHPDDRQIVDDVWRAAFRGQAYDIEHRIVVAGEIKWVRQSSRVDFDGKGRPVSVIGTVRDITRRKQTEDSLRLAASVFEGSGEAILVTDAGARILSVNQAFTRMSGYTLDEVKGKNPRILASGQHDAGFYRAMWEAINRDGLWQGEIWDRHKGGRIYPKLMSISAIKDESGAVTNYMAVSADISERKEAEKNIHTLAYYDVLTSLPNRVLLRDRIEQLVAAAHRDRQKFALLFIDLDRFKYVNDSLGHAMGDSLLQAVAQRLLECVREGDTVSRIGGDEFIVLLRETDVDGAALVAEKILKSFATVTEIEGIPISTNASIGISIYPDHAADVEALIKNADVAMYFAKEEGRNNFQFYRPELNFHAHQLFSMEADLRLALERNEFTLHYQPQLDLTSGKICGAEALVRWNHPQKGLISPTEFIPVAEETGQILPIGEWVLRTACAQLAAWRREGMAVFPVSVNLSIRQLRQANLAQLVAEVLEEAQLQPGDLELELTEGIMLGDTLAAMSFLTRMHELGVRLSIDDFGTGYSSLSYLKKMPLDRLKIDQSFVHDLETDENDAAIVRSIISLGHRFKLRVVAEGVETQEQMDFLRIRGCDEIQGYYFSRPLPADEFAQFIRSKSTQM